MKEKKFFAAAICATMILTGCSETPNNSSSDSRHENTLLPYDLLESTDSESTSSSESSSTTFTNQSSSSSSTSSSSSSSSKSNTKIQVHLYPEHQGKDQWTLLYYLTESDGTVSLYDCPKVLVYESSNPDTPGSLVKEVQIPEGSFSSIDFYVLVPVPSTTKYYRIKLVFKDRVSEYSNALEIKGNGGNTAPSSNIPRYTHTFTAPSYLTVIPDYSEVLSEIERGETPGSFTVKVRFTCPGCGHQRTYNNGWSMRFPYSRDGSMSFTAECSMSNCPYNKLQNALTTRIESHAVRLS